MKRLHLFEWEDFSWYPASVRQGQTDFLRFLIELFKVYKPIMPLLATAIQKTGSKRLVDFCSGGGGAVLALWRYFQTIPEVRFRAVLSDLYPNYATFKHLSEITKGDITFLEQAVDASNSEDVPTDYKGFYTFFNSFHHFEPPKARLILQNAVEKRAPIGIFEPMEKSLWQIIANTIVLIVLPFLVMPFLKPFSFQKLFFTYILPLIPFCLWWDGMVSVLRLYSPKTMLKMAEEADSQYYTWEAGTASHFFGKVTYLIGIPKVTSDYAHVTQTAR